MTAETEEVGESLGPRMLRVSAYFVGTLFLVVLAGAIGATYVLYRFGRDLPDYSQLADYQPAVTTRVHAADGSLIAEYARQKRLFVPINVIPKPLIDAFLSAEDKNFYHHKGLDFTGILRAAVVNARNILSKRRPVGASTITQQVAKNFLLSGEVSYQRKIKEAILAFRIERAFTKQQILELYLNEIYLGMGSYGVAAAALNYFDKGLDDLTLPEMAYLAALPKAPNNYHPIRKHAAAVGRRNWVLGRMVDEGYISPAQASAAAAQPLEAHQRTATRLVEAAYFTEEVRRRLYDLYGEKVLYEGGLSVRTTLDTYLQKAADKVLRDGLIAYDRKHGWRGPITRLSLEQNWLERLTALKLEMSMPGWQPAVVLDVDDHSAFVGLVDGTTGQIPFAEMKWARPWLKGQKVGPLPERPDQVLAPGDVVAVEPLGGARDELLEPRRYGLRQRPDVEGALVALDPHSGRIRALVGGFDYRNSQFNRATQALRQPGSAFKPIVYAAALDNGFTPSSLILDAPFVIEQGYGLGKWKPGNYSGKFYGPSTLRLGLEKSRNLMTVRLAQYIGMDAVIDYAKRFQVIDNMPPILSMALGAGETTLLRLTSAYATFVNGGKRIIPTTIDRIQDRRGHTVFRHDRRPCEGCMTATPNLDQPPHLPDDRDQILDPRTAYQIVSMLQGVVERGTGVRIRAVGKPLAGKTGTTNDFIDAWFVGFSPDLVAGVFVGFDEPRSLGPKEEAARVAVPVFRDFMKLALAGKPAIPFRIPAGIRLVRVNAQTGLPARPGDRHVIFEAFRPGTEPRGQRTVLDGSDKVLQIKATTRKGTGGLY